MQRYEYIFGAAETRSSSELSAKTSQKILRKDGFRHCVKDTVLPLVQRNIESDLINCTISIFPTPEENRRAQISAPCVEVVKDQDNGSFEVDIIALCLGEDQSSETIFGAQCADSSLSRAFLELSSIRKYLADL